MMKLMLAAAAAALIAAAASPGSAQSGATAQKLSVDDLFGAWLDAFNSGDRARIKRFYADHAGDPEPTFALEQAEDSCGLDVERVAERSAGALTVLLRQRCLPGLQRFRLQLSPDGGKVQDLKLRPLPLPTGQAIAATQAIAQRLAERDDFAGSLIIRKGDRILLERSWGMADPQHRVPITTRTPMFLASAGKMFTAVAVLQLVAAGKVELDAPLGRYLPDYPNAEMAKVTIRQLLTHRGGTGDIGILERGEGANRAKVRTIADMIRLNGARAPSFPPGSKDEYSNYGFILLGAVIERVSGASYQDYVARNLFRPAGMKSAGFPDLEHLDGVALGLTTFYGAEVEKSSNRGVLPWRGASAGGGVASAEDMLRFFGALRSGKLLGPDMLNAATTPGPTSWYGLGFVTASGSDPSWGHGGMSYGMDVAAHHYPAIDTTFICLATRDMACNRLIYAWALRTMTLED
jgi:D-alanyl-D-alanine carboxypeptidase